MKRTLAPCAPSPHGKAVMGGEPLVFHCNYYNYFLQKTLLLDDSLGMDQVIVDAAESSVRALLFGAGRACRLETIEQRRKLATDTFSELGFGLIDLSDVGPAGGMAKFAMSHYGSALRIAAQADFAGPQSYFDAGYAAAAATFIHGRPAGALGGQVVACQALGAKEGCAVVAPSTRAPLASPGQGFHQSNDPPPPRLSPFDEAQIHGALSTLDFSGNEEGLIPHFGVMLTRHLANFYNRISFEFVRRMDGSGLRDAAEGLLVEAGLRCAFHTFGGIMVSEAWDALMRPQCRTREDWVHGAIAVANALGWGVWRVHELTPGRRLVARLYDDYESCGYLGMYGRAERPVSYLAAGGLAGLMNLVYVGDVAAKPDLDAAAYGKVFESDAAFEVQQTKSLAMGDECTEVTVGR